MLERKTVRLAGLALTALMVVAPSCKGEGKNKSEAAKWIDSPSQGTKAEGKIKFPQLGVMFERPTTLYVFKNCGEAGHSPDSNKWVPVIRCGSTGSDEFGGNSGTESAEPGGDEDDDPFGGDDDVDEFSDGAAEEIDLTIFVTKKTRPMDERTVSWFENQYKQQGLAVDEISYQHDHNKKEGIYFKLHVMDRSTNTPTREIIQFMFPRGDVVFIARMEYPFGETRSVDADWNRVLWGFDWAS
jgi:hypothetical protein